MKKMLNRFANRIFFEGRRSGVMEYLEDASKPDEHYIRLHEHYECWGIENTGAAMALIIPAVIAGTCKGLEKEEREWSAVETKCIGLGDPYCEFKIVPAEIDELRSSLEKEREVIERIHDHLMMHLMGFLLEGKPLLERPKLGSDFLMAGEMALPAMARERYRMAMRMGGAKSGKEVGERLMDAGIREDDAVEHLLRLLEHCKVGEVAADETLRIRDNCESAMLKVYTEKWDEPLCPFTTGFLNGFFSAVKNQHVKETKCIAMGDPYCEWEFR